MLTLHIPCALSTYHPTYFHNPFIYLILTFYPYLASHSPCHVHFIHFPSILLHTSILLSYVLDLGYPIHPIHFIPHISSIPFISLSLFHTLPPISLLHSTFMPMLVITARGTIPKCSYMLWTNTCLLFLHMLAFVPSFHFHASFPTIFPSIFLSLVWDI